VGKALGDAAPQHYLDLQTGGARLKETLSDKVCLLILDDIWNAVHAEVFLNALNPESRSRILITTRDRQLVSALGASEHRVDALNDEQSLRLLADWAGQEVEKLPPEAREVIQECGALPLALAMIGAMVRGKPKNRWGNALSRLRTADLEKIGQQFPNYLYPDLLRAMQVSVKALPRKPQKRYLDFAVFPEDTPVPEAALQIFWRPQGLDEHDTADVIDLLVSRSLARRDEDGNLTLHDLQFDYVRKQHKNLLALHDRLLNAYAALCSDGWHTGPDDGYFFAHLLHHLEEAGRVEEIYRLLAAETGDGRNAWFEAKESTGDLAGYRNDVAHAWRLAEERAATGDRIGAGCLIGLQARYAVITLTLNSMVARVPPAMLTALVEKGIWRPARGMEYARQSPDARQRAEAMAGLMPFVAQADREDWLCEALKAVRAVGDALVNERRDWPAETIISLISRYPAPRPDAALKAALDEIRALRAADLKAKALIELKPYLPRALAEDAVDLARGIKEEIRGERWEKARAVAMAEYAHLAPQPMQQAMWEEAVVLARKADGVLDFAEIVAALANNRAPAEIETLLQECLAAARKSEYVDTRAMAMAKLAPHFSGEAQRQAIREAASAIVVWGDRQVEMLAGLASQLPPELCQELLDAARRIERHEWEWENWTNGRWREKTIISLIPHLSEERRNKLANDVCQFLVDNNRHAKDDDKESIFGEMVKLAPYLSKRRLKGLMVFARSIRSKALGLWRLRDIIPSLPSDEKDASLREAMDTILAMPDKYSRENCLKAFAPLLPAPMLEEALATVTAIGDEAYLIRALPKMFASLPAAEKEQALRLAMAVTSRHEWCADVLAELAPSMSEPTQAEALDLARGMKEARFKARLLAGLIPALADAEQDAALNQAQTALEKIHDWRDPEDWAILIRSLPPSKRERIVKHRLTKISWMFDLDKRAASLFHLSPFLAEADLERALRETLSNAERRAGSNLSSVLSALKTLAPLLSEPLLGEMLSLARSLGSDWHQNEVLSVFAKRLAETGDYRTALDVVKESYAHYERALAYVIPYLPKSLIADAMNLGPWEYALAELCPRLAEFGEVEKAVEQARRLRWPNTRASALLAVAPHLSEEERDRTLKDAMADTLQIEHTDTRRELLERLAPLLAQCSPATLSALWREAISSLAKRGREQSVHDLYLLTPAITALAGQEGAAEVLRAIRDAARWWP
jgi:hypothetical protein